LVLDFRPIFIPQLSYYHIPIDPVSDQRYD